MNSTRCAACKCQRRKCESDCLFSPYFPSNNPQRYACVKRIYGERKIKEMLQELPVHLRADAADSLYYEARSRIQDPVYGCVGIITRLHQEINNAHTQLAKAQAEIAFLTAQYQQTGPGPGLGSNSFLPQQNGVGPPPLNGPSTSWF